MPKLSPKDLQKQIAYRDARFNKTYDKIWQSVGKCVFCDLKPKYIIFEEHNVVLAISLFAYVDGHVMIIPRRHVRSVKELTQEEWETFRKFMYIAKRIIKTEYGAKGMQIVQKDGADAQSTVEHLHFHCIPFNSGELSTWNYQKLTNTPLQNTAKYRAARKKILTTSQKFDAKYLQPSRVPIICDAILINTKNELLLERRDPRYQLKGIDLTPPGGLIHDLQSSLEAELSREIHEETGLLIPANSLKLVNSQICHLQRIATSATLRAKYLQPQTYIWNTYVVREIPADVTLRPGDDAEQLLWMPLNKAIKDSRISEGIRKNIAKIISSSS